jgi:hypothetical protein
MARKNPPYEAGFFQFDIDIVVISLSTFGKKLSTALRVNYALPMGGADDSQSKQQAAQELQDDTTRNITGHAHVTGRAVAVVLSAVTRQILQGQLPAHMRVTRRRLPYRAQVYERTN